MSRLVIVYTEYNDLETATTIHGVFLAPEGMDQAQAHAAIKKAEAENKSPYHYMRTADYEKVAREVLPALGFEPLDYLEV
jgi:hypothetical protein